jgi:hypothetical protein
MEEVIREMFNKLWNQEHALLKVRNYLRNQNRFNRAVALFAILSALKSISDTKTINALTREIEELKKMKGE